MAGPRQEYPGTSLALGKDREPKRILRQNGGDAHPAIMGHYMDVRASVKDRSKGRCASAIGSRGTRCLSPAEMVIAEEVIERSNT
jgi:hypothetical protein